jgi:hypothetical protein
VASRPVQFAAAVSGKPAITATGNPKIISCACRTEVRDRRDVPAEHREPQRNEPRGKQRREEKERPEPLGRECDPRARRRSRKLTEER